MTARRLVKFFVGTLFLVAVSACDIAEDWNRGTMIGYTKCIQRAKDQGVEESVAKPACIEKHEKKLTLTSNDFNGTADVYKDTKFVHSLNGQARNATKRYIITSFTIVCGKAGAEYVRDEKEVTGYFQMPGELAYFTIPLPVMKDRVKPNEVEQSGSWWWNIKDIKGIEIKL